MTAARVLAHGQITAETIFGAICIFVFVGMMFGFVYLAIDAAGSSPFFRQDGPHDQGNFRYSASSS